MGIRQSEKNFFPKKILSIDLFNLRNTLILLVKIFSNCSYENNIENLFISKNFEIIEPIFEVKQYPEAVLVGIELPNTIGKLRVVSEQLLTEGYFLIEEKTYPGFLKLIYFKKG